MQSSLDGRVVRWGDPAEALARIGPEAVPPLIKALKDPKLKVRYRVAEALGKIGPPARAAVPTLIAALKEEA